jgi:dolichyl-diphosphooligosaccharide---protein glycosyltransferase
MIVCEEWRLATDIKLEYLEEAFTTSNWIVRIYKVKPPKNRS